MVERRGICILGGGWWKSSQPAIDIPEPEPKKSPLKIGHPKNDSHHLPAIDLGRVIPGSRSESANNRTPGKLV